jgi:hypothetical protein
MRSKDIGTAAETALVKASLAAGIHAQRVALAGTEDRGDVHLAQGAVVAEVKAGKQTLKPSWAQKQAWLDEAKEEAARVSEEALPVLVLKRHGSGQAGDWFAYLDAEDLQWWMGHGPRGSVMMMLKVSDLLKIISRTLEARND